MQRFLKNDDLLLAVSFGRPLTKAIEDNKFD
jgi:hypothetical protein